MKHEQPAGEINGTNTVFTLSHVPVSGTLSLYLNGLLQNLGVDYTLNGNIITLTSPPQVGDWLFAIYEEYEEEAPPQAVSGATLLDIASWAAVTRLRRPDLVADAVLEAKGVYLLTCGKVPFESLQGAPLSIPLRQDVAEYSLGDVSPVIAGIISVYITGPNNFKARLRRSHIRVFDSRSTLRAPRPSFYARWGHSLVVWPVPSTDSYTMYVRYWSLPTVSATEPEKHVLVTPPEWDELFKWETLYRMYSLTEQHDKAAALVMGSPTPPGIVYPSSKRVRMHEVGIIPRLWNDLLQTIQQREHVDEDFSVNPVIRPYTW